MNKGNRGVHICRVASLRSSHQGKRPSAAERNQRLRAIAERLKAMESGKAGLADANSKTPTPANGETDHAD